MLVRKWSWTQRRSVWASIDDRRGLYWYIKSIVFFKVYRSANIEIYLNTNILTHFSGMELCLAASINDLASLKAWREAGVDMGTCDYDGRSALLLVFASFRYILFPFWSGNFSNQITLNGLLGKYPIDMNILGLDVKVLRCSNRKVMNLENGFI